MATATGTTTQPKANTNSDPEWVDQQAKAADPQEYATWKTGYDKYQDEQKQDNTSTTDKQAAAGAQAGAGNTTAGTTAATQTGKTASTGSGLPAYGANYNFYQTGLAPAGPGAGTSYQAPGSLGQMGVDYNQAQYNTNGAAPPNWSGPQWQEQQDWNDANGQWDDANSAWNGTAQFRDPTQDSSAAHAALQSVLGGDASGMDTSAMKNRLKEQALQMQKDQMAGSRQAAAGRGMLDSGYQSGQERRIGAETSKSILGSNRDIDIAAAQESTKNKLAASEALNSLLTGDTSRENTAFQAKLLGEDTGFKNTLAGADTAFKNKLAGADTAFKNRLAGADTEFSNKLAGADTGYKNQLEGAKFSEDQNQFGAQYGLDKQNAIADSANKLEANKQAGAGQELDKWKAGTEAQQRARDQDIEVAQQKTNELLGRLGLSVNLEEIARGTTRDKMQFLTDIFQTLVQNEQHNQQMGLNYSQLGQNMNQTVADLTKSLGLA